MRKHLLLLSVATGTLLISCKNKQPMDRTEETSNKSIDVSLLDSSFNPGDDFFEYVNHKWIASNPIPDSKSSWGAFNELDERSKNVIKEILEKSAQDKGAAEGSNTQIIGAFYRTGMDSAGIEKAGMEPIKPLITEFEQATTKEQLSALYAKHLASGTTLPFGLYVDQDLKATTQNIGYIYQSGLGLPDRDYYFRTDEKSVSYRNAYQAYIVQLFELMGADKATAETKAKSVLAIENALANASMTLVDQRDPYATYNKMSMADFQKLTNRFDWNSFFKGTGIATPDTIVVGQPNFFKTWNSLLGSVKQAQWADYYTFHVVNSYAEFLSSTFDKAHFDFYERTLSGKKSMEERWKRISDLSGYLLRDLIGQEYVKVAFDENAKTKALALVNNLKLALGERIAQLSWMGDTTKQKAQEKLDKIMVKIGYPEKWRSYQGLVIKDQHFVHNVMAGATFEFKRMLSKLGKPIDRTEWYMGPQTVNAYYNPTMNEIVFPAAILQPPFFDANADDAVNYGGIGMVIGHELTHGFDDQGRQFDADGNLKNWWTPNDEKQFKVLAAKFVSLYKSYIPVKDIHIDGDLTLGENIADLGGMIIAYAAFKKAMANKPAEKIDGLTPDQRFFINFAQIWRGHDREDALIQRLYTDPHSPRKYRVIGVLSNFPEFYSAFNVQPTHKMYTPDSLRCIMW